jgi:hypothetical protein
VSGNGLYRLQPPEGLRGPALYKKEGDDSWWLEHFDGEWQLKQTQHKGSNECCAKLARGSALESLDVNIWSLCARQGSSFVVDRNIKCICGEAAEKKVPCPAAVVRKFRIR